MTLCIKASDITGVILAGGKSSRMGRDKALLQLNDAPFIEHIAEKLKNFFFNAVVVADSTEKYSFLGLPVFPDLIKGCGPLGGIHSALSIINTGYAFVISCDMPLAPEEAIREILKKAHPEEITIGTEGKNLLQLFGLYPKSLTSHIEKYLLDGKRRVCDFINDGPVRFSVTDLSPWREGLSNINYEADYLKLK